VPDWGGGKSKTIGEVIAIELEDTVDDGKWELDEDPRQIFGTDRVRPHDRWVDLMQETDETQAKLESFSEGGAATVSVCDHDQAAAVKAAVARVCGQDGFAHGSVRYGD